MGAAVGVSPAPVCGISGHWIGEQTDCELDADAGCNVLIDQRRFGTRRGEKGWPIPLRRRMLLRNRAVWVIASGEEVSEECGVRLRGAPLGVGGAVKMGRQ